MASRMTPRSGLTPKQRMALEPIRRSGSITIPYFGSPYSSVGGLPTTRDVDPRVARNLIARGYLMVCAGARRMFRITKAGRAALAERQRAPRRRTP